MNQVTVALSELIDRVIYQMHTPIDLPLATVSTMSMPALAYETDLTLGDADMVSANDVLEIDSELLLVVNKTADLNPILTCSRGYYGTEVAEHAAGTVVKVNPRHPRARIAEAVRRAFPRLEALGLPLHDTKVYNRVPGLRQVELDADTRDVTRVSYVNGVTGLIVDLDGWRIYDQVPTSLSSTGKMLRLPRYIADDDDLYITRRVPYRWSTHPSAPDESATITMIEGTEDLPALYAAAWLVARRDIARTEIDRAEEWIAGEPSRGGVSSGVVRLMWQEFYRALDEARRLEPAAPLHRPFVPMPKVIR